MKRARFELIEEESSSEHVVFDYNALALHLVCRAADTHTLLKMRLVCRVWRKAAERDDVWRDRVRRILDPYAIEDCTTPFYQYVYDIRKPLTNIKEVGVMSDAFVSKVSMMYIQYSLKSEDVILFKRESARSLKGKTATHTLSFTFSTSIKLLRLSAKLSDSYVYGQVSYALFFQPFKELVKTV